MTREGPSVSVTRKAVDMGIFVVAAAGNDGGDDDGRVSVPVMYHEQFLSEPR